MEKKLLIQRLQNQKIYNFPIKAFHVIETHHSFVLLTGRYAFKIKKPVKFSFLDFSTLKKRHFFCKEELKLNKRLAKDLYIDLVTITNNKDEPSFNGKGPIIEYAVQMHEFNQNFLFSNLLKEQKFSKEYLSTLAKQMAFFHLNNKKANLKSKSGTFKTIKENMDDNFKTCRAKAPNNLLPTLKSIINYSTKTLEINKAFIKKRKINFVRDCHGDFHLNNVVLFNGVPTVFDCIDFNPTFRFIDVIDEIAFFCMDLESHQATHFAYYFLNQYLSLTGDYEGIQLFKFYEIYRAMVRAKVALLNSKKQAMIEFKRYLMLARNLTQKNKVQMILLFGPSGASKTYLAENMSGYLPAIHIRSDVERKRLYQGAITHLYSEKITKKTYTRLFQLSEQILQAGFSVIVDATFLKKEFRLLFQKNAKKLGASFVILEMVANKKILEERIQARRLKNNDISDATIEVMWKQLMIFEPLTKEEKKHSIRIDSAKNNLNFIKIAQKIKRKNK